MQIVAYNEAGVSDTLPCCSCVEEIKSRAGFHFSVFVHVRVSLCAVKAQIYIRTFLKDIFAHEYLKSEKCPTI